MEPLTLFTWGYWGWGTATNQLIRAVDEVEASRGYQPPMFVDVRLSRSVRAPGFNGRAFENALGKSRYRWLEGLGNLAVQEGGAMRIRDPAEAVTLLEIAETAARSRQRVLFFCSCEFPGVEGQTCCHRVVVARLVLEAAASQRLPVEIVEWPGGEPESKGIEIELPRAVFAKVGRGGASIPLEEPAPLAEIAGLPWLSLVSVYERENEEQPPFLVLSGPARYVKGKWQLPIHEDIREDMPFAEIPKYVKETRQRLGFGYRRTKQQEN